MTCDEAVERMPDGSAELAEHLGGCASCRSLGDAYERDGELLAAGLRALANRPAPARPAWRLVPVAAAAALLLGVFALLLRPAVGPLPASETEEELPEPLLVSDDPLWGTVIAADPARETVAVSAGADDRVAPGQVLTLYRRGGAAETEVGTLVIDRVEPAWSSGRLRDRRADPRAGDFFVSERLLDPEERARLLDYLFTFRPVPAAEIRARIARLGPDDAARLLELGAPVRILLEADGIDLAARVRAREAIAATDDLDRRVRPSGLDHDVEFLAKIRDPRAHARLRAILSGVPPFAREGLPPPGARLAARLHDWWNASKDRLRWNALADRYEEK